MGLERAASWRLSGLARSSSCEDVGLSSFFEGAIIIYVIPRDKTSKTTQMATLLFCQPMADRPGKELHILMHLWNRAMQWDDFFFKHAYSDFASNAISNQLWSKKGHNKTDLTGNITRRRCFLSDLADRPSHDQDNCPIWGAVVDKSKKHSIHKNFEINYIFNENKEKLWNEIICTLKMNKTLEPFQTIWK